MSCYTDQSECTFPSQGIVLKTDVYYKIYGNYIYINDYLF